MIINKLKYIVVEGNIGAGKTSLARKLAVDLNATLVLEEFAENSFLPKFYENPSKYAFPLEFSFLAARFKQLKFAFENQSDRTIVSDYHFQKTLLFATQNLDDDELALFQSFHEIVQLQIPEPELFIFLQKDLKQLQHNISKRGRGYEKEISPGYLEKIDSGYQDFLNKFEGGRILNIDTNSLDFVKNHQHYLTIIDLINNG